MRIPLFFPTARIVVELNLEKPVTLAELAADAGVQCRASGPWINRRVELVSGVDFIEREPSDWGGVRVGVPSECSPRDQARYALGVLAYGIMDVVARQIVAGQQWSRPSLPRGRKRTGKAMSPRQRQRKRRVQKRTKGVKKETAFLP
jgi:hypothetical protein